MCTLGIMSTPSKRECLRLIVALRVSTAGQAVDGYGLAAQERDCRRGNTGSGHRIVHVVADGDEKGGKTGKTTIDERDGLMEAMEWIADGRADGILARTSTGSHASSPSRSAYTWALGGRVFTADHGVLAGAAVLGFPFLLNPGTAAEQRIERLEAIGQWLNELAGIHTAGISLVQTIRASARNAPAPIAANVRALDERLRSGMDSKQAFALFADELGDGVVDHVALLFQSHAANMGPGLSSALEALAVTIHQQAAGVRDIESDRAKIRKSSRIVSIVICIVFVGCMLNEAWSAWYQSPAGQLALAVLGGFFAWTLAWLRRAAVTKPDPRLLNPLTPAEPAAVTGAVR